MPEFYLLLLLHALPAAENEQYQQARAEAVEHKVPFVLFNKTPKRKLRDAVSASLFFHKWTEGRPPSVYVTFKDRVDNFWIVECFDPDVDPDVLARAVQRHQQPQGNQPLVVFRDVPVIVPAAAPAPVPVPVPAPAPVPPAPAMMDDALRARLDFWRSAFVFVVGMACGQILGGIFMGYKEYRRRYNVLAEALEPDIPLEPRDGYHSRERSSSGK